MTRTSNVVEYISRRLSEFFILTNEPYEGATDFNREHPLLKRFSRKDKQDGIKLANEIHKNITDEVINKFSLHPKKIGNQS